MVDHIGRCRGHGAVHVPGVEHVNGVPVARRVLRLVMASAVGPGNQARIGGGKKIEKMAAGKPGGAGHENGVRH